MPVSPLDEEPHRRVRRGSLAGARVLVVSHGFQPNYERGFSNGLADAGAEVLLVSSDRSDEAALRAQVRSLNLRGAQDPARAWWRKAANLMSYHARLLTVALRRRECTVHVIGLLRPLVWCGVIEGSWFRLVNRRYVLTVHNLLPHDRRQDALTVRLHKLSYRIAHVLVVHTDAMKQQLISRFGVAAQRIVVMEHGIEVSADTFHAVHQPVSSGPLRLLFFGALMRYKGLDLLLQALQARPAPLSDWHLRIAGPCVDAVLAKETAAAIERHPRRNSIEWTRAYVAEADVSRLFMQSDVLVLPYRHIDQSGVLFQALRHGLPIIATDVGSLRRYVDTETGLVCAPGSVADLANALHTFAARRERFSRRRIRAKAQRFAWVEVVSALAIAYGGEIASGPIPASPNPET